MTHYEFSQLMDLTGLSPENLAPYVGISNITLRRWKQEDPNADVSENYDPSILEGVYRLIVDNHLHADHPDVQKYLESASSSSFSAAIQGLGVADIQNVGKLGPSAKQTEKLTNMLSGIGLSEQRRQTVDHNREKILNFKKFGEDWKRLITTLIDVIKSHDFTITDKLVAYGALFYLIYPFDLIPDQLPVVGYIDDFAFLTMAAGYYSRRLEGQPSRKKNRRKGS